MENKFPLRFFIFTFLWSWFFWGIAILLGNGNSKDLSELLTSSGIEGPLMTIGIFGPAFGAFVSLRTINGKGSIKPFIKSFLSLKFGWKVWLSIFLVLGLSTFIAWIIPEFFGHERILTYLPSVYIFPVYLLLTVFFMGGQEEIGWRGYILPFLEKRFGLIIGSLILGIVWAIWHLPLWFIPGSAQGFYNFFVFMLGCIGYSYFFSWVIKASGNRLLSGLFVHGVANAFVPLFPTVIMEHNVSQIRLWIYVSLTLIIGIIIVSIRTIKERKTGT
jgi:membrane protease YdiL (CAAX protease family)